MLGEKLMRPGSLPMLLIASFWLCSCATDRYRKGFDYAHILALSGWRTWGNLPELSVSYWVEDDGDPQLSAIYAMYRAAELAKESGYKGFILIQISSCGDYYPEKSAKRFEPDLMPKEEFKCTRYELDIRMSQSADMKPYRFYVADEVLTRLEPHIKRWLPH